MTLDIHKIAKIANVTKDMAYKYKTGHSLPRLDKAIKLKDELGIPVEFWVELKQIREASQKK